MKNNTKPTPLTETQMLRAKIAALEAENAALQAQIIKLTPFTLGVSESEVLVFDFDTQTYGN